MAMADDNNNNHPTTAASIDDAVWTVTRQLHPATITDDTCVHPTTNVWVTTAAGTIGTASTTSNTTVWSIQPQPSRIIGSSTTSSGTVEQQQQHDLASPAHCIAYSPAGDVVAVACASSIEAFSTLSTNTTTPSTSTTTALQPLWSIPTNTTNHSMTFVHLPQNNSEKNWLAVVTQEQQLVLYDATTGTPTATMEQQQQLLFRQVTCCCSVGLGAGSSGMAVGYTDGRVRVLAYDGTTTPTVVLELPPSQQQTYRCTYVAEWGPSTLAIGYETIDATQDVELHVVEWTTSTTEDDTNTQQQPQYTVTQRDPVGDVVPFFREEEDDVHCFYTAAVLPCRLAVVATNLGTDLGLVVRCAATGHWMAVDIAEPYEVPIHEDEFMHPAGIATLSSSSGLRVVLAITDGSVVELQLETEDPAFQPSAVKKQDTTEEVNRALIISNEPVQQEPLAQTEDHDDAIPAMIDEEDAAPKTEPPIQQPSMFGGTPTPAPESTGTIAPTNFGFGASGAAATQQKPSFGSFGAGSSVFGSTAPAFGSGQTPTLSFGSAPTPLFAPAASSHSSKPTSSLFGGTSTTTTPSSSSFLFGTSPMGNPALAMAKPLFGGPSPQKQSPPETAPHLPSDRTPAVAAAREKEDELGVSGTRAAQAFDAIDTHQAGTLPVARLEDLVDQVGEGLHGDELDRQQAKLDPSGSGKITRTAFIRWYEDLADNKEDDGSTDDEEEEKEEERVKARKVFATLAKARGGDWMTKDDFSTAFASLGSTYCEEDHDKSVTKLAADDGKIRLEPFLQWYIDWLFGDPDDDDGEPTDTPPPLETKDTLAPKAKPASNSIWDKAAETSWTCSVCSVGNTDADTKCVACETPREGSSGTSGSGGETRSNDNTNSGIGPGGFSFGGGATASTTTSGIGAGGFSFGGTPAATTSNSGGFSFGAAAIATTPSNGGFSLGGGIATAASGTTGIGKGGFSFGGLPAATTGTAPTGFTFTPAASSQTSEPTKGFNFAQLSEPIVPTKGPSTAPSRVSSRTTAMDKRSGEAFDSVDTAKTGSVSAARLEELIDAVGEGLHGDERDAQAVKLDPTGSGKISRQAFIQWYASLGEENDDDSDEEEKAEERENALRAFSAVVGSESGSISKAELATVMQRLGTTDEAEHARIFNRLANEGQVFLDDFLTWYIGWIFHDDDDDSAGQDRETMASPGFSFGTPNTKVETTASAGTFSFGSINQSLAASAAHELPTAMAAPKPPTSKLPPIVPAAPKPPMSKSAPKPPTSMMAPKPPPSKSAPPTAAAPKPPTSLAAPKPPTALKAPKPPTSLAAPKPPMAKQAPKPPMSTAAPKPPTALQAPKPPTSLAAPKPPMAFAAPKPPTSLAAPKPPMAKQAPKPPMSTAAPKPPTALQASKPPTSLAAPKPPMAFAAPKPPTALQAPKPPTSLAAPKPPMAKQAPKPPMSTAAPKPPMTEEAPKLSAFGISPTFKPFGSSEPSMLATNGKDTTVGFGNSVSVKPLGFSSPNASQPSPFSTLVTRPDTGAKLDASFRAPPDDGNFESSQPGIRLSRNVDDDDLSEVTEEYIALVRQMEATLSTDSRPPEVDDKTEIESFVNERSTLLCNAEMIDIKLNELKAKMADLLHSKSESLRLVYESKMLVESIKGEGQCTDENETYDDTMDEQTKARRRQLHNQVAGCKSLMNVVNRKSQVFRERGKAAEQMKLSVLDCYQRSRALEKRTKSRSASNRRQIVIKSSKHRNLALSKDASSVDWNIVEQGIQGVTAPRVKTFELNRRQLPSSSPRRTPFSTGDRLTPTANRKTAKPIFSPSLPLSARPGWAQATTTDQERVRNLSLNPPTGLRDVTLGAGAANALSSYGTTREKVQEAAAIKDMGSSFFTERASPKTSIPVSSTPKRSKEKRLPVLPDENRDGADAGSFLNSGFGTTLPSLAPKSGPLSPRKSSTVMPTVIPVQQGEAPSHLSSVKEISSADNYRSILGEFYNKHAPGKSPKSLDDLLLKYKGREEELFGKLAKKYGVPNPLSNVGSIGQHLGGVPSPSPFAATNPSPFSNPTSSDAQKASPFAIGGPSSASPLVSNPSPFSSPPPKAQATPQAFGTPPVAPGLAATGGKLFAGKTAREILVACYQKYNPTKLNGIDDLLAKYNGREEQMIRSLSQKYKFDPRQFGIQPAAPQAASSGSAPGFGQPSPLGGMSPFGQPSPLGGGGASPATTSPSPFGGASSSTFGSGFAAPTSGFGALASSPAATPFATPPPFASPFGAPRK